MKKIIISTTFLITLIVVSIYGILFTKKGNGFISYYLENIVNEEQKDLNFKINNFTLTTKDVDFEATLNENSYINISGALSLFKKNVDLKYDIKIEDLSIFKNLISEDLKGTFFTNGIFKGSESESIIQGFSNIASSETKYYMNLVDFKLKDIYLDLKDAKIDELLAIFNKPLYANGNLNLNANIKNIDKNSLDGLLIANISKGLINNDIFNKEFNQKINTKISFNGDINASLLGNIIEVKSDMTSSVADIFFDKTLIDIEKNTIQSDYKIDVKNLAKLEGLIGKKLQGEFLTTGNILKDNKNISVDGNSDIFDGFFTYKFELKDYEIQNLNLNIEKAKLEKIFFMLNEPIYAVGNLELHSDIKNSNIENLDGSSSIKISDAKIINEVVNTVFKKNLKDLITFKSEIKTSYVPNQAISQIDVNSNIAQLNMNKAIYDFSKNTFNSDYNLNVFELEALESFTKVKMRGAINVVGTIENSENFFKINGNSNLASGQMNFNLINHDLVLNLNNANLKDITYMMFQPEIFDSKTNLDLKYNLLDEKGTLNANLLGGRFLENNFSNIVNQLAKYDLTKDVYETAVLSSKIDNKKFITDLTMKNKNNEIEIKDSLVDFDKNIIDAKIDTKIKNNSFFVLVKGDMNKPTISLDVKNFLKNKIDKKIEDNKDKIEEKLNKVLKDKDSEKTKELIKNIKSLF
ncbi:hypothetical protein [Aliarcobacter butzleri]|uniref:Outer membrane protein n=1 Tax=Aliarcobacter butzleri TaxID=28197 RepID=A0AAP4UYI8_9BACT|nr:hypothetical protein [Aliarcobacter butzleri]MCG3683631.1 hypothetical protein [Aliarcobacter butzleri]MDN5052128.1 hypothetical protein [Aliarcobacter butzleri]MDN5074809.1 hypothetical protein [Aliarcobacter butzleri]MDN5116295.1 hypothetical protein [Aliarcobacter butzleri]MDN5132319.1 hypothetical protein [Aliarcobacter butzleri]